MTRFLLLGGVPLLILSLTGRALGATAVFTNEASFLRAVRESYYLEDFDAFTFGSYAEPAPLALGPTNGFSYTMSAPGGLFSADGGMTPLWRDEALDISFTGSPVTAIGGLFWPTEDWGQNLVGDIRLSLSDGTTLEVTDADFTTFRGFVSDGAPFTSMSIAVVAGQSVFDEEGRETEGHLYPTVDHFYVGQARDAWNRVLTLSSSGGGRISLPGEGTFEYPNGERVTIEAVADPNHQFLAWRGTGVGRVSEPNHATTTVLVDGDYNLHAFFVPIQTAMKPMQVLYSNDFQDVIGSEWSHGTTDITLAGSRRFLGRFGNASVTLTLRALPPHASVRLSFDLFAIRSWDGNQQTDPVTANTVGPESWSVALGDGRVLLQTNFSNVYPPPYEYPQAYPGSFPDSSFPAGTGAAEWGTLGYTYFYQEAGTCPADAVYRLSFDFDHSASTCTVKFSGSDLQGLDDESWGLDNVTVELGGTGSEPVVASLTAYDPSPADGAQGVSPSVLRWKPGRTAAYHDVYLGRNATLDSRTSTLSRRQTATECVIPYALVPGLTYYWRVDEVEGDGVTTHTGEVWSFTADDPKVLTVWAWPGGSVVAPGEGEFVVDAGTVLSLEAVAADPNHEFWMWSGTGVENGKVAEPNVAKTSVLVDGDYTLEAVFAERPAGPALAFSLGEIDVDDPQEYEYRVSTNNTTEAAFVERVTGVDPDPNGMVRMQVVDGGPARAKVRFGRCYAERVFVRFQYLFATPDATEIVVYLSDVAELLGHDDPLRVEHYVEIGRVPAPPAGCPGSFGSGRFGTFEAWASAGWLDFSDGTWVELELVGSPTQTGVAALAPRGIRLASGGMGGSAFFDKLAAQVHCPSGVCMNVTWDQAVDWQDLLMVMASCGGTTELPNALCLDGTFSDDGYVDSFDVCSWDWVLEDLMRAECGNLCRVPLTAAGSAAVSVTSSLGKAPAKGLRVTAGPWPTGLLVLGKPSWTATVPPNPRPYGLYCFSDDADCVAIYNAPGLPGCCNVRVVRGPQGQAYLVNTEQGVLKLSDSSATQVISPGAASCSDDPRYHRSAAVYLGLQGQGSGSFGRPILDVAFDAQGYAYVVPVVVQPVERGAYVAAAKLELEDGTGPSWRLVQLYDDPPPTNDNRCRDYLREIEVDASGNVYVLNVHHLPDSCILWKYSRDGMASQKGFLQRLDGNEPVDGNDPLGLCLSHDGKTAYLASGQYNEQDPDNAVIYGLSTGDLSLVRSVTVKGMELVSAIAENPATGELWVVGFSRADLPAWSPDPFYVPYMARIPLGQTEVQAIDLGGRGPHDLVLPTSITWTGATQ